jgi:dihydrofolate reductase
MRKIIFFNMVTLDGCFAGPNGELDWHNTGADFNTFAIEQLHSVDTILFGRKTYQLMENYWPTATAITNDPVVAGLMNNTAKIVFSKTLDKAGWNNTRLVKDNIVAELTKLQQQPGKDLIIFGSANLSSTLINHGLIDEFRLMVNPLILGKGQTLFTGIQPACKLRLIKATPFEAGNVLLFYKRA